MARQQAAKARRRGSAARALATAAGEGGDLPAAAAVPATSPGERRVVAPPSVKSPDLREVGGSPSRDFNNVLANQACAALWLKHSDDAAQGRQFQATIAALVGIAPGDEIEGMLAAQLVGLHNAAMECLRRAMLSEQPHPARMENLSHAGKLSRSYAALVEALNRHRGKGQQKVTVEHVHVHEGGQAIVGAVTTTRGEGDAAKTSGEPHAS